MTDTNKIIDEAFNSSMPFECWEQLTIFNETGKAYAAFSVFRDMDPAERSIKKAFDISNKNSTYKQWCNWSAEFKWSERVAAYDRHKEKLRFAEHRKDIETVGEKQREAILEMLNVMITKLKTMQPGDVPVTVMAEWLINTVKANKEVAELFLGNDKAETKQNGFSFEPEFKGL